MKLNSFVHIFIFSVIVNSSGQGPSKLRKCGHPRWCPNFGNGDTPDGSLILQMGTPQMVSQFLKGCPKKHQCRLGSQNGDHHFPNGDHHFQIWDQYWGVPILKIVITILEMMIIISKKVITILEIVITDVDFGEFLSFLEKYTKNVTMFFAHF